MSEVTTTERSGVHHFESSRRALSDTAPVDDDTARARSVLADATRMISIAMLDADGATRFDVWAGPDAAVVHARSDDEDAPVAGMIVDRSVVPLAVGALIVARTGTWPLGTTGRWDARSLPALDAAVGDGSVQWALLRRVARRGEPQGDLHLLVSDGSAVLGGVTSDDTLPVLVPEAPLAAMGRLLECCEPDA